LISGAGAPPGAWKNHARDFLGMSAFDPSIFDEPDSADASAPPNKFKFAPTFVIDFAISFLFVAAIAPAWKATQNLGLSVALPTIAFALLILGCYAGKVFVVSHLDRRGGDARAYVKSPALVTDGPYAYSRHPTYFLAMVQFLLWSALALFLQIFLPWRPTMLAAAVGLPLAFFLINEIIVMPTEEAMLRKLHPQEFDAYAGRVRRWFGRGTAKSSLPHPP
jgi:protein-S-isoprenylcysteine O-methyltransferase Ste14